MYSLRQFQTLGLAPFTSSNAAVEHAKIAIWLAAAFTKVVLGVGAILVWRIIAKRFFYTILPPLFKLFQPIISLPRKGYETARSVSIVFEMPIRLTL